MPFGVHYSICSFHSQGLCEVQLSERVSSFSNVLRKKVIKQVVCHSNNRSLEIHKIFYVFVRREIIERKTKPDIPKLEVRNSVALKRGLSPRYPSS